MSHLRDIMQRLGARGSRPEAPAADAAAVVADYERHLEACSPAMLHYEWSWLEQHLDTLDLSLRQPAMLATLGGEARAQALRHASRACQERLRQRLEALGEVPGDRHGPVLAGEHAWELSHGGVRCQWGIGEGELGVDRVDPSP
ncbi:MAG: hypothetical protein ACKOZW_05545 [Cyanobium sp.]